MQHKSLKVTAILANGWAGSDPYVPLDSLLGYAFIGQVQAARKKRARQAIRLIDSGCNKQELCKYYQMQILRKTKDVEELFKKLEKEDINKISKEVNKFVTRHHHMRSLKKHFDGDYWYNCCSFAIYEKLGEYTQAWRKRFRYEFNDLVDFQGRKEKVNIGSGQYRAYNMPLQTILAKEVYWYLIGEPSEIEELLSTMYYIGKKTGYGNGEVLRWKVEEVKDVQHDFWQYDINSNPLRSIPIADIETADTSKNIMYYGYRPPYWKPEKQAWCYMP